jgi:hypothetical protein
MLSDRAGKLQQPGFYATQGALKMNQLLWSAYLNPLNPGGKPEF